MWDKGSFRATEILLTMKGAEVEVHPSSHVRKEALGSR